jgi:hypothetical protein
MAATAFSTPFTQLRRERLQQLLVRVMAEGVMSERDKMLNTEAPKPGGSERLGRAVELAKRVLKERGLTDEQIEVLLKRPRAPEDLR